MRAYIIRPDNYWAIIFFILVPLIGFSQIQEPFNVDSLNAVFIRMDNDTAKVNLLNKTASENYRAITDIAFSYVQEADSLARLLNYKEGAAMSELVYSRIYRRKGQKQKAIDAAERSLAVYSELEDELGQAKAWKEIALANRSMRKLLIARGALENALSLFQKFDDPIYLADIYNIYTGLYSRQAKYDSAAITIRKAHEIASKTSNYPLRTSILTNWGNLFIYQNINDSAIHYYQMGIDVQLNEATKINHSALSGLYANSGIAYKDKGDFLQAIDFMLKSIEMDRALGYEESMAGGFINIGNIYDRIKNHHLAIDYYQKAYEIYRTLDNQWGIGVSLSSIATQMAEIGQLKEGLVQAKEGYQVLRTLQTCTHTFAITTLAEIFLALDELDSAGYYYRLGYSESEKCGRQSYMAMASYGLGAIAMNSGNYQQALDRLLKADDLAASQQLTEERKEITLKLYELYKKLGKSNLALKYFEESVLLRDTLYNQDKAREISQIEYRYELDREKNEMTAEQERQSIIYEQEIQQQRNLQYAAFGGLAIFGLISFILYRFYQSKKRDNKKIESQSNELKAKNDQLVQLSTYKQGLTQMIAHDMKNPLNVIISLTERDHDAESWKEVGQSGKLMLQMVHNMLDIQRFEEAKMQLNLKGHSLRELIVKAKYQVELLMMAKSIKFQESITSSLYVNVDPDIVLRILVNLYTNAIKYMPIGGTISMDAEENGDRIKVRVSDTGKGIPEELQSHIFDKFWQSDPKKYGMTTSNGLGLTFCKMAVMAHGGTIEVESKGEGGATFIFDLERSDYIAEEKPLTTTTLLDENLTEEEAALVKALSIKLQNVPIYKSSKIEEVLAELTSDSLAIVKWKQKLREASYSFDNEAFEELIDL